MNFRTLEASTIFFLGLAGLLVGAVSLTGRVAPLSELALWVLVGAVWIAVVLRRGEPQLVLTLVATGFVTGLWKGVVQSVFAHVLVANHPSYAAFYPEGVAMADRAFFAVSALLIAIAWGALAGIVAAGLRRWRNRPSKVTA